jgi:hypothetical protein
MGPGPIDEWEVRVVDDERRELIEHWCRLGGFAVGATPDGRLSVTLDASAGLVVEIAVGAGEEPTRVHDRFSITGPDRAGLRGDVVEAVVLGRSAMIDARIVPPGTVETVVAVYPDGLTRHAFMTAAFEIQKVRDLIRRGAAGRAADAATVAELERLVAAPNPLDGEG